MSGSRAKTVLNELSGGHNIEEPQPVETKPQTGPDYSLISEGFTDYEDEELTLDDIIELSETQEEFMQILTGSPEALIPPGFFVPAAKPPDEEEEKELSKLSQIVESRPNHVVMEPDNELPIEHVIEEQIETDLLDSPFSEDLDDEDEFEDWMDAEDFDKELRETLPKVAPMSFQAPYQYSQASHFSKRLNKRVEGVGPENIYDLPLEYYETADHTFEEYENLAEAAEYAKDVEAPLTYAKLGLNPEHFYRETYKTYRDPPPNYEDEVGQFHEYARNMEHIMIEQNLPQEFQGKDKYFSDFAQMEQAARKVAEKLEPPPEGFWRPPEHVIAREPSNWAHIKDARLHPLLKHLEYEIARRLTPREVKAIEDRWNVEKMEYLLEWRRFDMQSDEWFANFIRLRPWEQRLLDTAHRSIAKEVEEIDKELESRQIRTHIKRFVGKRWRIFRNRWQRRFQRLSEMVPKDKEDAMAMITAASEKVHHTLSKEGLMEAKQAMATGAAIRLVKAGRWLDEKFNFLRTSLYPSEGPTALELARAMDLRGKVALITGGKDGIGMEVAKALAVAGAKVIITSRDPLECRERVMRVKAQLGLEDIYCLHLDLSDFNSIVSFVSRFQATGLPLHILINNAATIRPYKVLNFLRGSHSGTTTQTLGSNLIGPMLLTELLLPHMAKTGGRIINVSCGAHRWAAIDADTINRFNIGTLSSYESYAMSKLGNIIHAQDIAKRMDPFVHGITANSVNPGMFIDTPLLRNTSIHWLLAKLGKFTKLTRTPEQAAAEIVNLAGNPALKYVTGKYFENFRPATPSKLVLDPVFRERWTEEMTFLAKDSVLAARSYRLQPLLKKWRIVQKEDRDYPGFAREVEEKVAKGEKLPDFSGLLEKLKKEEIEYAKEKAYIPSPDTVKEKMRRIISTPYTVWKDARTVGADAIKYMKQHNFEPSPIAAELIAGDPGTPFVTFLPAAESDDRKFLAQNLPDPAKLPIERKLDEIFGHYRFPVAATGAPIVHEKDPRTPLDIRQQAPGSKPGNPFVTLKDAIKKWVGDVVLYNVREEERRYKEMRDLVKQREHRPPVTPHKLTTGFLRDYYLGTESERQMFAQMNEERMKRFKELESKDDLGIGLLTMPNTNYRIEEVVHPDTLAYASKHAWELSGKYVSHVASPLTRRKALLELDEIAQRKLAAQPPRIPVEVLTEEQVDERRIQRHLAGMPSTVPTTREEELRWVQRDYDSWVDRHPGATKPRDDPWWNVRDPRPGRYSPYSK